MKQARDIIRALFDEKHAKQAETFSSLFDGWKAVAGDDIAAHSRIVDIKDGTVLVEADHPGWLQMIGLKEKQLVNILQRSYPSLGIARLRIRTAANPELASAGTHQTVIPPAPNTADVEELRDRESPEYLEFKGLLDRVKKLGDE